LMKGSYQLQMLTAVR